MANTECTVCGKDTSQRCGHCKSIHYCSQACQKDDYSMHKLICKEFVRFTAANERPSDTPTAKFTLAFVFPEFSPKPTFIWAESEVRDTVAYDEVDVFKPESVPNTSFTLENTKTAFAKYRRVGKGPWTEQFQSWQRHHVIEGSVINTCIKSIVRTSHREDWTGPVVILKVDTYDEHFTGTYQDVTCTTFRGAIHYLSKGYDPATEIFHDHEEHNEGKVGESDEPESGVRITFTRKFD